MGHPAVEGQDLSPSTNSSNTEGIEYNWDAHDHQLAEF